MYGEDLLNSYYSDALTSSTADIASQTGTILGVIATFGLVIGIIGLIISVLTIIANWKIFTKAGEKGWKSLIPIYGTVVLFRIAGVSPLLILGYLAAGIPVVGLLITLGITIYVYYKLAKAFGQDAAFTVGLVLLNTIFILILGFGKSEYQLNKNTTETVDPVNQ